jgi:hypothetical protein
MRLRNKRAALRPGFSAFGAEDGSIALWAMNIYAAKGGSKNRITGPTARWKRTPIPACGGTFPQESMSLDSQVASLPYKSSSLATPLCGGTTTRV